MSSAGLHAAVPTLAALILTLLLGCERERAAPAPRRSSAPAGNMRGLVDWRAHRTSTTSHSYLGTVDALGVFRPDLPEPLDLSPPEKSFALAVASAIDALDPITWDQRGEQNLADLLRERFKLDVIPDTEDAFLHMAAVKRGAVASGGKVNMHKICELLIKEFRSGKLGRISLETPALMAQEQIGIDQAAAQRASDKAERKQRFKEGAQAKDKQPRDKAGHRARGADGANG